MSSPLDGNGVAAREYWMHYDHQTGRWVVDEAPPKVIRMGAEVIHVREVGASPAPSHTAVEPVAWLLEHPDQGDGASIHPITDGDRSLGWKDTPLGPLSTLTAQAAALVDAERERDEWRDAVLKQNSNVSHNFARAEAAESELATLKARIAELEAKYEPALPYTTGHCESAKIPGGCPLHNLHCGWPECDRRARRLTHQEKNG